MNLLLENSLLWIEYNVLTLGEIFMRHFAHTSIQKHIFLSTIRHLRETPRTSRTSSAKHYGLITPNSRWCNSKLSMLLRAWAYLYRLSNRICKYLRHDIYALFFPSEPQWKCHLKCQLRRCALSPPFAQLAVRLMQTFTNVQGGFVSISRCFVALYPDRVTILSSQRSFFITCLSTYSNYISG